MKFTFLQGEYWYGGIVNRGCELPIGPEEDVFFELVGGRGAPDQYSPLFLSSKGRILHSENAFNVQFRKGEIEIDDTFSVELLSGFDNLRGACLEAAKRYFPLSGKMPDRRFFQTPQYNTWIELMYEQNEKDILRYAETLIEGGMPPGILMIDEGWAPDYGIYDFDRRKFNDPKDMVEKLHRMGFSVMLWVTPHISPDSATFRELRNTALLLHDKDGKIAIREWWNGFSCVLDFTNPETGKWMKEKLHGLMVRYGIDGFKFDSGDTYLYRDDDSAFSPREANAHTAAFNRFCGEFTLNELRNVWDSGGEPIVCRLQDKSPVWDRGGLAALLPNMLTQGLLGYFYGCPDMIGGGQFADFVNGYRVDEELYLRWLAASLFCPMIQFSISPKRILTDKAFQSVQKLSLLRGEYVETILALAERAAKTGEPIMRYMAYEFPECGYEKITDQFMLGERLLVAPLLEKGCYERTVELPRGIWQTRSGERLSGGGAVTLTADVDDLILLQKIG